MPETSQRLFGRRKGRPLRVRKSGLMQTLLPHLQIDLPEKEPLQFETLFPHAPKTLWLEIGFGGGEHLAAQAAKHPSIGFIGCEPFVNGIASLLDHVDRQGLKNIRLFPNDARLLLDALPEGTIDRCFVLFADPWPKARHAERRFIGPRNIPALARAMRKDAELRLATDDANLAVWMREAMEGAKDFSLQTIGPTPPADWVETRYEQKAIKAGRAVTGGIRERLIQVDLPLHQDVIVSAFIVIAFGTGGEIQVIVEPHFTMHVKTMAVIG
jgi:tRNA (guanine-N7-)-methyltransferase